MTAPIDTLRLDLPSAWIELPIAPDEVESFLAARSMSAVWQGLPAHERRQAENLIRRLVNELRAQRCQMAAVYAEVVEPDEAEEHAPDDTSASLLLASCVVSIVTREEVGTVLTLTPDILLSALTTRSPNATQYTELELPAMVSLAAGPAVRTLRLQEFAGNDYGLFVETFMMPIAPEYEAMCVLQFASPTIDMAGYFSDLFGAIAQTFAVYREGEPTPA